MTELAALAHDAEQEHVVESILEVRDEMAARDLLLRIARLDETERELKQLLAAITDRYQQRLAGIETERDELKRSLETFLIRFRDGKKIVFPDAGTAYLTTRNKGGKAKLLDADAFVDWLRRIGESNLIVEYKALDARQTLELAHDALFYTTPDGKLVRRDTGEVIEIDGVIAMPEMKTLAVRKP